METHGHAAPETHLRGCSDKSKAGQLHTLRGKDEMGSPVNDLEDPFICTAQGMSGTEARSRISSTWVTDIHGTRPALPNCLSLLVQVVASHLTIIPSRLFLSLNIFSWCMNAEVVALNWAEYVLWPSQEAVNTNLPQDPWSLVPGHSLLQHKTSVPLLFTTTSLHFLPPILHFIKTKETSNPSLAKDYNA